MRKVSFFVLNGRMTNAAFEKGRLVKNKVLSAYAASNYWSSSENNTNNAWNVNFNSGNVNNNNKYNSNYVRPCAALDVKKKEEWLDAFDDCCRHKKSSDGCIRYRINYEYDLFKLADEVESGRYKPSTSVCFCVTRPKLREVFAANFRDRIVHHWLMLKLNPLFEELFISQGNVSYNCRKGFGTYAAVNAVRRDINIVSHNHTTDAYIGRFDLISFFPSIHKKILIEQVRKFIYEKYKEPDIDLVFKILCIVINHNPATDCEIHGNKDLFKDLPKNKSLFYSIPDRGLPIGNLTSQILANFYLSTFDEAMIKWCKLNNGCYERFVDDYVVIVPESKMLYKSFLYASDFLQKYLSLNLHEDKKYMQHYSKGIKFVGYVIKFNRIYLSNRTFGNFEYRLKQLDRLCKKLSNQHKKLTKDIIKLNAEMQAMNSYIGFSYHTNNYGKRLHILLKFNNIYEFIRLTFRHQVMKIKTNYNINNILYEKDKLARGQMSKQLHDKR